MLTCQTLVFKAIVHFLRRNTPTDRSEARENLQANAESPNMREATLLPISPLTLSIHCVYSVIASPTLHNTQTR